MEKYENYIWDFDGTLFESYKRMSLAFWKALNRYACEQGIAIQITQKEIRQQMKQSVGHAWRYCQKKFQLPETVMEDYNLLERTMPEEPFAPFPETGEVLDELQRRGCRHFVYTHRGVETTEYLQRFGLASYFTGLVTGADGFPPKPSPKALLYLMETYQIRPETALMVGDRTIDMQAAHHAGIAGCLLDPEQEIAECSCEYYIQNLKELTEVSQEDREELL